MSADAVADDRFPLGLRPCVPVSAGGVTRRVGFRELFIAAHYLEGLAVTVPPAASGLMRVLYAMAARITGLDTARDGIDAWLDRRFGLLQETAAFDPGAVDEYFDRHADGLRLHDPARPFLQEPRLADECSGTSGVNKLVLSRPAGNNPVFFGHFVDTRQVALPSGEAMLHLLAQLYYGPSGQCTTRTVDGQRFGNTMAGPLRRVLSCHPVGRNLYETLLLGIPAPDTWPGNSSRPEDDLCPWEHDRPLAALEAAPKPPSGPMAMLTGRFQHAVLLRPDPSGDHVVDATITWGLRVNRPEVADPYLIWDEAKDGSLRPRDAKAERALWRDLDALILQQRARGGRRPPVLDSLTGGQLPEPVLRGLRVVAYGFDQDGQTRDRTYFSAVTPHLISLLEDSDAEPDTRLARGVETGKQAAETAAWRLETALRAAWREYTLPFTDDQPGGRTTKGKGPWPEAALAVYWPAAEGQFWGLFDAKDFTNALQHFGRIALSAFDDVTASVADEPRGARAREKARGLVRSLLSDRQP
ncbi:type I-E CRISPR-associated protein Cse1/CasA [Streptomyces hainanensis]|uniref:type I-E CRISPR-associated protein Cse1/CasA n=1 Tax=Streptomyces hainanensis TaxID=402648 RepID=UPI001FB7CEF4|nr:type I-E CRISPR-associated protein Cse1/CasA [Streptomyces hainanensis]